jgi:hypothetical protein
MVELQKKLLSKRGDDDEDEEEEEDLEDMSDEELDPEDDADKPNMMIVSTALCNVSIIWQLKVQNLCASSLVTCFPKDTRKLLTSWYANF